MPKSKDQANLNKVKDKNASFEKKFEAADKLMDSATNFSDQSQKEYNKVNNTLDAQLNNFEKSMENAWSAQPDTAAVDDILKEIGAEIGNPSSKRNPVQRTSIKSELRELRNNDNDNDNAAAKEIIEMTLLDVKLDVKYEALQKANAELERTLKRDELPSSAPQQSSNPDPEDNPSNKKSDNLTANDSLGNNPDLPHKKQGTKQEKMKENLQRFEERVAKAEEILDRAASLTQTQSEPKENAGLWSTIVNMVTSALTSVSRFLGLANQTEQQAPPKLSDKTTGSQVSFDTFSSGKKHFSTAPTKNSTKSIEHTGQDKEQDQDVSSDHRPGM